MRGTAEREREEKEEMTASSELLADLDEAFATAQGDQDRAKILRTIQVRQRQTRGCARKIMRLAME